MTGIFIPDQAGRARLLREISHFHDLANDDIISLSRVPDSSWNIVDSRKLSKEGLVDKLSFISGHIPVHKGRFGAP